MVSYGKNYENGILLNKRTIIIFQSKNSVALWDFEGISKQGQKFGGGVFLTPGEFLNLILETDS